MSYSVSTTNAAISLNESNRVKSVLQNISMILRTRQGTVPMYREFGLPMDFLDKPVPAALPILIIEVKEAIERFEPRAEFVSAKFTYSDTGELMPEIEVNITDE